MAQDPILAHLKRIRGQIDGIIKMYQDERTCVDIIRQVIAARSSLGKVAQGILSDEAAECSREQRYHDLDDILKEVFRY